MEIIIKGIPLAKQSARFAKRGKFMHKYQPKKITDWNAQARLQMINQLPSDWSIIDGPVRIEYVHFIFPIPKSISNKKKDLIIEGNEPECYKTTRPDIDNCMKALWDACNGILFTDDSRIVDIQDSQKLLGVEPCIKLKLGEIE